MDMDGVPPRGTPNPLQKGILHFSLGEHGERETPIPYSDFDAGRVRFISYWSTLMFDVASGASARNRGESLECFVRR